MKRSFNRRLFLGSAAATVLGARAAVAAPPLESLRPVVRGEQFYKRAVRAADVIIQEARLTGKVAFAVADADSGKWLECDLEHLGTAPASTAKAITALYALDALGPEHQFETRVLATGGIENGEVQGDLVLVGGGDPTLDTDALVDMAAKVKAAGVTGVKGGLKVFEAALPFVARIDPEQPDHVGYNPGLSGIALNFNRVHFEWKRSAGEYAITMDARSGSVRPDVAMATMRLAERSAPVYTYSSSALRDEWTVARAALGGGGARWLPVRKPGLYAGDVFATMCGAQGIRVGKPQIVDVLPEGEVLVSRASAPLRGILRDMLRFSTNLTAEMVGLAASAARGDVPGGLRSSAARMNDWAKEALNMRNPQLVDHSGLGDDSLMTAADMTRAMVAVNGSGLRDILRRFGMRDAKGAPLPDHPIDVQAKTGTLNFVSGLSGYMTAADGREMAFTILAIDPDARAKITRELRERPDGARVWNRRAKRVQQQLIERWGVLYGTTSES